MKKKEIKFGLHSLKQKSSYLNSLEKLGIDDFSEKNLGLNRQVKIKFDDKNGLLKILLKIDFKYILSSNDSTDLFGIETETNFHFINFEEVLKISENEYDVPDELLINLISIAFSSARGIMFCLTSKTDYDSIYLPLTNPADFLKNED